MGTFWLTTESGENISCEDDKILELDDIIFSFGPETFENSNWELSFVETILLTEDAETGWS